MLRLSQAFKFSGSDVDKLYRECAPCRAAADKVPKPQASGRLYEHPSQQVNIDLCEMVLGGANHSVFVAVDDFAGLSFARVIQDKTAAETCAALYNYVNAHVKPERVCTDNGGELQAELTELRERQDISMLKTASYSPWRKQLR